MEKTLKHYTFYFKSARAFNLFNQSASNNGFRLKDDSTFDEGNHYAVRIVDVDENELQLLHTLATNAGEYTTN